MTLKTAFDTRFKVGASISRKNLSTPADLELLLDQFNSFTCENDMKPLFFLDEDQNRSFPGMYGTEPAIRYDIATPYLQFSKDKGIPMRGHTLVWHNQTPEWFFHESFSEPLGLVSREIMLQRLEHYIKSVLTFVQNKFPGRIYAWDVVNEVIDAGNIRPSLWTEVIGEDFYIKAFEFARKYATPGVKLFYNDYNTFEEEKREAIIGKVLKPLMERGLIDGMGMQTHLLMDVPDPQSYEKALHAYGALGLDIHITEMDIHNSDPSEASMNALAARYKEFFDILVRAKDNNMANITSVTFWNLTDEDSWLTLFRKETSYPLLFGAGGAPKKAYYSVLETVSR